MEGVPAPSPSAALKDEGNTHFKAGNFLKAAALYTQAIKKDPENAALYRSSLLPSCTSQLLIFTFFNSRVEARAPVIRVLGLQV